MSLTLRKTHSHPLFTLRAGKCFVNSFHDGGEVGQRSIGTRNTTSRTRAKGESYIQGGESFAGRDDSNNLEFGDTKFSQRIIFGGELSIS
jgi:hypothetical protein